MTVTLDDLVEYSQGIDARLATLDVDKLKDKIRYGVNNLATQELCFSMTETVPFSQFINIGLTSFSITPSKEIINYYLTTVVNSVYDPFLLPDSEAVTLTINDDKSITVGALGSKSTFHAPNGIIFTTPDKQLVFLKREQNIDYPQILDISDQIKPTFQKGVHDGALS